jgi:hypothetical protein
MRAFHPYVGGAPRNSMLNQPRRTRTRRVDFTFYYVIRFYPQLPFKADSLILMPYRNYLKGRAFVSH